MAERRSPKKVIYFLKEDLADLDAGITSIKERVSSAGQQVGEAAGESYDWHDNFAYEQAQRDRAMWTKKLIEMTELKQRARRVEPDYLAGYVGLGRIATFEDLITGQVSSLRIGSYQVFKDDSISYTTPVARLLLGASIGTVRRGRIGGEEKHFRIINVK